MTLCNAASDKVAYCAEYGIEITESQWPCRYIPDSILADRGELEEPDADSAPETAALEESEEEETLSPMLALIKKKLEERLNET